MVGQHLGGKDSHTEMLPFSSNPSIRKYASNRLISSSCQQLTCFCAPGFIHLQVSDRRTVQERAAFDGGRADWLTYLSWIIESGWNIYGSEAERKFADDNASAWVRHRLLWSTEQTDASLRAHWNQSVSNTNTSFTNDHLLFSALCSSIDGVSQPNESIFRS